MEDLIRYFTNLLILQYKNKPRAKATIEALTRNAFSDTQNNIFPIEVQNAYDLDTATGKQLDVLGKYLGYDRILPIPIDNTFKFAEYDESINPEQGYSEYNDNKTTYPYAEYRYSTYDYYYMDNVPYRKVLKMISYLKGKSLSLGNINDALEYAFNGDIYVVEKDKEVEYHLLQEAEGLTFLDTQDKLDMFFNKYFPRPTGCSLSAIQDPYYLKIDPINGAEMDENYIFTNNQADTDPQSNTVKYFKTKEPIDARNHSKDIEFRMKFKVTSARSGFFCADPSQSSWSYFLSGYIFASRQLGISINANAYGSVYVVLDTWYWVRMTHVANSSTWKVEYSTDGINYSLVYDFAYSLSIPPMYMWLGAGASTGSTYGLSGSVDFKETDIIIDGKSVLWTKYRV